MLIESAAVLDIADMLRRDGHRLYDAGGLENCMYQSALCGLTASFGSGGVLLQLKGHDLQAVVTLAESAIEDDEVDHYRDTKTDVTIKYIKGDAVILDAWHRHLSAYRRSMRGLHAAAA